MMTRSITSPLSWHSEVLLVNVWFPASNMFSIWLTFELVSNWISSFSDNIHSVPDKYWCSIEDNLLLTRANGISVESKKVDLNFDNSKVEYELIIIRKDKILIKYVYI